MEFIEFVVLIVMGIIVGTLMGILIEIFIGLLFETTSYGIIGVILVIISTLKMKKEKIENQI